MPSAKKKKGGKGKQRKAEAAASLAEPVQKCTACGLPPRPGQDLLCCIRCEGAWYHDEKCQRDHFLVHKGQCRKAARGEEEEVQTCDGCGEPARPGEKLVYCSKCDTACYHGRECQLKHFREHKVECAKIAKRNANFRVMDSDSLMMPDLLDTLDVEDDDDDFFPPFVKVEVREGRGRCVIAREDLPVGTHPMQASICEEEGCPGDHGWMESLVPPVADVTNNTNCCSFCFKTIPGMLLGTRVWCQECHVCDPNLPIERAADNKIRSLGGKLPDARTILMSRVIRYSKKFPQVARDFDALCCNTEGWTGSDKASALMNLHNCHSYLQFFGGSVGRTSSKWLDKFYESNIEDELGAFENDIVWASKFLQNVQQLSVRHVGGFGIFPQISLINHSCKPNAVATLLHRETNFPAVQVTTCAPVNRGEELTLNYRDKDLSIDGRTAERQAALRKRYGFQCKCSRCLDIDMDDKLVGFVCPRRGCKGTVKSHPAETTADEDKVHPILAERQFICDTCGHSKFAKQARWQEALVKKAWTDSVGGRSSLKPKRIAC